LGNSDRGVRIWLILICGLITLMVSIGGITRLTGSGLSITDWAPILGAVPPLTESAWQTAFLKYQMIPQFKLINSQIGISEFKFLFFWEWFHRLVGRLVGIVSFIPGIYFFIRRRISLPLAMRVLFGVFLGGLQGALGWFMVKSGLIDRTSVSHFRLAAHLSLALAILSYFVWLTRSVVTSDQPLASVERAPHAFTAPKFKFLVALFVLQIIYGAFVAGMKAGFAFNTFPLMAGAFIPENLGALSPLWINFFENPALIQWIHRSLGWILFFSTNGLWIALILRKASGTEIRRWVSALSLVTIVQFLLGIGTLIFVVPLPLAVLHQFGAAVIVILLTLLGHTLSRGVNAPL